MEYGYDLSIVFCSMVLVVDLFFFDRAYVCAIAEIIDAHSFLFTVVVLWYSSAIRLATCNRFSEGVPRHVCTVYMDTLCFRQRLVGGISKVHC